MNKSRENTDKELELEVMRIIKGKPDITQRELADKLGHSLGKLNYCLRSSFYWLNEIHLFGH